MQKKVRALLYGSEAECRTVEELIRAMDQLSHYQHEYCYAEEIEQFAQLLVTWEPTLVIVLADGAMGMESVYLSKARRPELPVFWFSDDANFGIHSHRLNCAYFSSKPVVTDKLSHAFHRCNHVGIRYGTA